MLSPVENLAARLALVLASLSEESQYHLDTALRAAAVPGIGGTLIVALPKRVSEHPTVKWVGGGQQLSFPV